jgi:hypothetical protein
MSQMHEIGIDVIAHHGAGWTKIRLLRRNPHLFAHEMIYNQLASPIEELRERYPPTRRVK